MGKIHLSIYNNSEYGFDDTQVDDVISWIHNQKCLKNFSSPGQGHIVKHKYEEVVPTSYGQRLINSHRHLLL